MKKPLKLGIAGLGTVGSSTARIVTTQAKELTLRAGRPMQLTAVCTRSRTSNKDRGIDLSGYTWFDDPVALATSDEIDVFVELIGGDSGPAYASVLAALKAGKHVVTANKALIAAHGTELALAAEEAGVSLVFEAAVAGGIPIIKALREGMAGNSVSRVYGIMNGTCNYILTRMENEGLDFETCLKQAQELGYAEADPAFDIEGNDTAHKLAILTSLAFGTQIESSSIYMEGITSITSADIHAADELGYRIKLLGVSVKTDTGIEQRVHPTMVPKDANIAQISGVTNAVVIDGDAVGSIMLSGPGAGGNATASAVVADIVDIARDLSLPVFGRPAATLAPYVRSKMRTHAGGYYIRLSVLDRPGAFAAIAKRMGDEGISLESIVQKRRISPDDESGNEPGPVTVMLITHETTEKAIRAALDAINADGHIAAQPQMIRIER